MTKIWTWGYIGNYVIQEAKVYSSVNEYITTHKYMFPELHTLDDVIAKFKELSITTPSLGTFIGTDEQFAEYKKMYLFREEVARGMYTWNDAALVATLINYAQEFKHGKRIEVMTVLNQVGRAIKENDKNLINQDYERIVHSMLLEMYSNHRGLYTALFYSEKMQEDYQHGILVDFLKQIFQNQYILGTK